MAPATTTPIPNIASLIPILFFRDLAHFARRSEIDIKPLTPSGKGKMTMKSKRLVLPAMPSLRKAVASDASSRHAIPIHELAADRAVPKASFNDTRGNGGGAAATASWLGAGLDTTGSWLEAAAGAIVARSDNLVSSFGASTDLSVEGAADGRAKCYDVDRNDRA